MVHKYTKAEGKKEKWMKGWAEELNKIQNYPYIYDMKTKKFFKRFRWGDNETVEKGERCHDCGVLKGSYHGDGCDMETDPRTGSQLFGSEDFHISQRVK
jgi:hypothetical protein